MQRGMQEENISQKPLAGKTRQADWSFYNQQGLKADFFRGQAGIEPQGTALLLETTLGNTA